MACSCVALIHSVGHSSLLQRQHVLSDSLLTTLAPWTHKKKHSHPLEWVISPFPDWAPSGLPDLSSAGLQKHTSSILTGCNVPFFPSLAAHHPRVLGTSLLYKPQAAAKGIPDCKSAKLTFSRLIKDGVTCSDRWPCRRV